MGDPTAAQEPSMEEILASIRQIISEDGEPEAEGSAEENADQAESAGQDDETSTGEPEDNASTEAEAEDTKDADDEDEADEAESAESDDEPALAEIAEGVQADAQESEQTEPELVTMEPASDADEQDADEQDGDDLVQTGAYESPFDTFQTSESSDDKSADPEEKDAPALTAEEPSSVGETLEQEDTPVAVEATSSETTESEIIENPPEMSESQTMTATAPQPAEYTGDEKLISADAGASVSNAFSTLTHTILSQNARTLDDLVSDMLQPMLKEWLDENLPTLVERMVKQEIDRMARGGRV